ncbi:cobalamin binding intrinsic factor-like isoform X2 [Argiope bruennichi]|uniref:cobalamin binding intrinsic factor-like isoform X2 n=1 Tax=Argiope bruennichi TaxID=94029 RepID=UPI00249404F7|nr:cobalamin binding intrinsic factor-like isoform X2 [Argiope bruennichi]
MEGFKMAAFAFVLWGCLLYSVHCQSCEQKSDFSSLVGVWTRYPGRRCWVILVPTNSYIHLWISKMESEITCDEDYLRVNITGTSDEYKFCSSDRYKNPITAFSNVTVTHEIKPKDGVLTTFTLKYIIKTGVMTIKEVPEVIKNSVSWMKRKRVVFPGWKENTPRAVVALYLSSAASFNGTVPEEELMAKEIEFSLAISLLKPSLTNSELSMFINALLVTCHNPRQFYGIDMVKRLKDQMEESGNFTHPLAYLTLCNANESWPLRANSDLDSILSSSSEYPFMKDLQAMAVMALSCNYSRYVNNMLSNQLLDLYNKTIHHFKSLQTLDGSFGNVYTTALITQALFSSGEEHSRDWNLNATIKYLMKKLNYSSVDFLATYLILPILNSKSLMDISYVNCSANPRKHGEDPFSEIADYLVPKQRVQYSLYIGDEKPVTYSIPLNVPKNSTAFEVMEVAEAEDKKYKFEWKMTSGKLYVYEIAGIKNDPEAGKFWMLYKDFAMGSEALTHLTKGPNEIIIGYMEHLVWWYRTATF